MASHPGSTDSILRAAREIMRSEGPKALTMARLADATGLSRATLYRRAGGREAILEQLVQEEEFAGDGHALSSIQDRILQGVRQAIHESGSLNFTVEQVAAAAGVGVATVYRRFGDKASLLRAFSEELTPRRSARKLLTHSEADLRTELINFAQNALAFMIEYQDLAGMLLAPDEQTQKVFGHLQFNQNRTLLQLTRYFSDQIERGRLAPADPFDLAAAFSGILIGLTFIKSSHDGTPPGSSAELAPLAVDLFLQGAKGRMQEIPD